MSTPRDDDAQRELERRALLNVHTLAERLGASDKLDRRTEKRFARWIAAVVGLVVLALGVQMLVRPENSKLQELKRCELDAAVKIVWDRRARLREHNPGISDRELESRVSVVHDDVKAEAARQCARGD
jgi:uncharacterized membrane protein YgaE (UPF0421/DUF939 family)